MRFDILVRVEGRQPRPDCLFRAVLRTGRLHERQKVEEPQPAQQEPVPEPPTQTFPGSPVTSEELTQPTDDKVKVALLLPLSGGSAKLGEALLHGAEMALFEIADNRFTLLVKDTGDTPDGARAATDAAIAEVRGSSSGCFSRPKSAPRDPARAPPACRWSRFSTDLGVAGNGVWVMGSCRASRSSGWQGMRQAKV